VPQQKDAPAAFTAIAATAWQLARRRISPRLRLNAHVARLYQLSREELEHVVGTFRSSCARSAMRSSASFVGLTKT
jgi:hypothetical protein